MSVTALRAIFNQAADGKASCSSLTLSYEDGGKRQIIRMAVRSPAGSETVVLTADPKDDLELVVRDAALAFAGGAK